MSPNPDLTSVTWLTLAAALMLASAPDAAARSSDRNKPMDISAGRQQGSLEDNVPTVLSGGVTIEQGTLGIDADRAVITSRGGDIVRVVFTGGPAKLKQQLDNGTAMNAVAKNVDYDLKTEMVVLTGSVVIKQPRGTLSGERVAYNMTTGEVNSGGDGAGRVRMRFLPQNTSAPSKPATRAPGGG